MAKNNVTGSGTKQSPWLLKTPSGSSEYQMYRDESLSSPALVCTVGKTVLRYDLRCLDDLHAMLKKHGDWMPLGSADERSRRRRAPSKPGAARRRTRSAAGMGSRKACAAGLECTFRR
jgi:hypothetical protein